EMLPRDRLAEAEVEPVALLVEQFMEQRDVAQLLVDVAEPVIEPGILRLDMERDDGRAVLARERDGRLMPWLVDQLAFDPVRQSARGKDDEHALGVERRGGAAKGFAGLGDGA